MSYGYQQGGGNSYQRFHDMGSQQNLNPGYPPTMGYDDRYGQSTDSFARHDPFADSQDAYSKEALGGTSGAGAGAAGAGLARGASGGGGAKQQHAAWMEGGKEPSSGTWKKWATIGGLGALVVAGIAGGITAWKLESDKSTSSSGSSSTSNSADAIADGQDPSVFEKDDRLHQSFYGFAYTPLGTLMPYCGGTQANVTADIQLISQLTTRIRTYGSDCNATNMILQAIQDTKVNMTAWLGVYVDDNSTTFDRQMSDTLAAIQTYGTDHVSGVIVGNEYILDQESSAASYTFIETKVADFRKELAALNLTKDIPVGTADAGSVMTKALNTHLNFSMANVHPWFGGVPIDQAAGWTWEFFQENDVAVAGDAIPYIAETGWPTDANDTKDMTYEGAVAGVDNLQIFLDTFVCQANANQTRYFFFEAFDEPWKEIYGGVEPFWGQFTADRVLKNITIPNCPVTWE